VVPGTVLQGDGDDVHDGVVEGLTAAGGIVLLRVAGAGPITAWVWGKVTSGARDRAAPMPAAAPGSTGARSAATVAMRQAS